MKYAIDRKETVCIGGLQQGIRIRTTDEKLPVVLSLHGGPGGCDRYLMMRFYRKLEGKVTLVCWDQRGSGLSYTHKLSKQQMTLNEMLQDTNELIDFLLTRFKQKKIFILGHSWGSLLGCYYIKKFPNKVAAFIGCGQLISAVESENISYNKVYKQAQENGDEKTLKVLNKIGKPVNGMYHSNIALLKKMKAVGKYQGSIYQITDENRLDLTITPRVLKEYSGIGLYKLIRGMLFSWNSLRSELMECNLMKDVTKVDVPIYLLEGIHDNTTPVELAKEWFDKLEAPVKELILFNNSAHSPVFEESSKFAKEITRIILKFQ